MATGGDQQLCQSRNGSHTTGGEALRTFSSSSSLSTSSSSLPSSLSSSPIWDDASVNCDYFTLRRSNGSVSSGITPTGSTSPPASLTTPRGGVNCTRRMSVVLLPQAQNAALATPCSRMDNLVIMDKGTGSGYGTTVGEEGMSTNGYNKVNTHPSTPAPLPTSESFGASMKSSILLFPTMSSQTYVPTSHSRAPPTSGEAAPHKAGPAPGPCSVTCSNNFARLSKELSEAKDQLFALSVQVSCSVRHGRVDIYN